MLNIKKALMELTKIVAVMGVENFRIRNHTSSCSCKALQSSGVGGSVLLFKEQFSIQSHCKANCGKRDIFHYFATPYRWRDIYARRERNYRRRSDCFHTDMISAPERGWWCA